MFSIVLGENEEEKKLKLVESSRRFVQFFINHLIMKMIQPGKGLKIMENHLIAFGEIIELPTWLTL